MGSRNNVHRKTRPLTSNPSRQGPHCSALLTATFVLMRRETFLCRYSFAVDRLNFCLSQPLSIRYGHGGAMARRVAGARDVNIRNYCSDVACMVAAATCSQRMASVSSQNQWSCARLNLRALRDPAVPWEHPPVERFTKWSRNCGPGRLTAPTVNARPGNSRSLT